MTPAKYSLSPSVANRTGIQVALRRHPAIRSMISIPASSFQRSWSDLAPLTRLKYVSLSGCEQSLADRADSTSLFQILDRRVSYEYSGQHTFGIIGLRNTNASNLWPDMIRVIDSLSIIN